MRIARFLERTEVEGPGTRSAIWLQGCSIKCPDCCNPAMLDFSGGTQACEFELAQKAAGLKNDGITLLGGEPLDQIPSLMVFIREFKRLCHQSIMLFTGYEWSDISNNAARRQIADMCDLVVAGPFIKQQSPDTRRWIGSKNQTVHFITDRYDKLKKQWASHRIEIEISLDDDVIMINGSVLDSNHELAKIFLPEN